MLRPRLPAALAALALCACQANPAGSVPTMTAAKQIAVGTTPHGMTAAQGFVYNSNIGDNTISVIDTHTDTVVKTIPVANGTPGYAHDFRDGKYILVVDTKQGPLMVFDPLQDHKLVNTVPLGQGPDHLHVLPDDNTVLASLTGEKKLVSLTFADDITQAPTRKEYGVGSNPGEHRAVDAAGGWAITPNAGDNNTSLINLADGSPKLLTDGNTPGPVGIATSEDTAVQAIVGNTASNTLTLFAIPSGDKVTLTDVGLAPNDMVVDADNHRAYVTMPGSNDVAVVDFLTKTLVGRVGVGARPVHIFRAPTLTPASPAPAKAYALAHEASNLTNEIWVCNDDGASVTVFDGDTLKVKATIQTDNGHHKMAFWGTKAYVSNLKGNDVSVIDRTTLP